jgi:hypothetical protein
MEILPAAPDSFGAAFAVSLMLCDRPNSAVPKWMSAHYSTEVAQPLTVLIRPLDPMSTLGF